MTPGPDVNCYKYEPLMIAEIEHLERSCRSKPVGGWEAAPAYSVAGIT